MILITYDVDTTDREGAKRLRRVAKSCLNHGRRVQNSVFECVLNEAQFVALIHELEMKIDKEKDNLRFYNLGNNWNRKVTTIGVDTSFDVTDNLII